MTNNIFALATAVLPIATGDAVAVYIGPDGTLKARPATPQDIIKLDNVSQTR